MSFKDPEKRKQYDKHWLKTTKGRRYKKAKRERWLAKRSSKKVLARAYHKYNTSEKGRATHKRWRDKVRADCIAAYGGKCQCCGELHQEILTIHHVNGGGHKHRQSLDGINFYYWLRRKRFPKKDYLLLCPTCHTAIDKLGYCFHHPKKIYARQKLILGS